MTLPHALSGLGEIPADYDLLLCADWGVIHHGPDRWQPLGPRVQVLQYPGQEADLAGGMDRLEPSALLPHLDRLR